MSGRAPKPEANVVPVPEYTPSGTPEGPYKGNVHNPIFRGVPHVNTRLIPPPIPMDERTLRFADMVWSGLTPFIAYRDVYGWPEGSKMAWVYDWVNSKLWSRPTRLRLHQLDKMACDMDTKSAENRRNFVLDGLTNLASDESISAMARLKALELLGKVRGTDLFTDRVEQVTHNMSEEQVKQALAEKLAQLGMGAVTGPSDLAKEIKIIEHVPDDTRAEPASHEHQPSAPDTAGRMTKD